MNTLKVNFDNTIRKRFGPTIDALERAFEQFGIDYYLIGAFVREVWTDHLNTIPDRRATLDLDFAILINEYKEFDKLIQHLIAIEGFSQNLEPYRLLSKSGTIVDLIPFGGIEKNSEVFIQGLKPCHLSVLGTMEVTEGAQVIEGNFKVITLPGLAVLKLISWNENPGRTKDIADFYYLLTNYSEISLDDLFKDINLDLVEQCEEMRFSGSRLLGREMASITKKTALLYKQIGNILQNQLQHFNFIEIDYMYKENKTDEFFLKLKLLRELIEEYLNQKGE